MKKLFFLLAALLITLCFLATGCVVGEREGKPRPFLPDSAKAMLVLTKDYEPEFGIWIEYETGTTQKFWTTSQAGFDSARNEYLTLLRINTGNQTYKMLTQDGVAYIKQDRLFSYQLTSCESCGWVSVSIINRY